MNSDPHGTAPSLAGLLDTLPASVEPPADLWPAIKAHIEAGLAADIDGLDGMIEALPRDVDSGTDLWPHIAARIGAPAVAQTGEFRRWPSLAAGLAFFALAGTLLAMVMQFSATGSSVPPVPATLGDPFVEGVDADDPWWIERMRSEAARTLPPAAAAMYVDTQAVMQRELTAVRRERNAVERALHEDWGNLQLWQLWQQVYAAELALVSEAQRVLQNYQRNYVRGLGT